MAVANGVFWEEFNKGTFQSCGWDKKTQRDNALVTVGHEGAKGWGDSKRPRDIQLKLWPLVMGCNQPGWIPHGEGWGNKSLPTTLFFCPSVFWSSPLAEPNRKPEGKGALLMQFLTAFRYTEKGKRGVERILRGENKRYPACPSRKENAWAFQVSV